MEAERRQQDDPLTAPRLKAFCDFLRFVCRNSKTNWRRTSAQGLAGALLAYLPPADAEQMCSHISRAPSHPP